MKNRNRILAALFFLAYAGDTLAQSDKPLQQRTVAETLESWIAHTETLVVPVADAMPEDKYSFAPLRVHERLRISSNTWRRITIGWRHSS